jgi:hypothetical protein
MISTLLTVLIVVLVAALICWLLFLGVDRTGIPYPFNVVAKVVVFIAALVLTGQYFHIL